MSRTSTNTTRANNAAALGKIRKAKTVAQPVPPVQPVAADVAEPDEATLYERARSAMQQLFDGIAMPSWTRRIVSTLVAVTVAAVACYGTLALFDMLLLAVMGYTASQFVLFVVAFVGLVMAMIAAVSTATRAFEFCMEFDIVRVKTRVSRWFTRTSSLVDEGLGAR